MLARFFIDRPIFAWVLSLVILLLGAVAAAMLPIAQYPPITPPTVQVTAVYPGANASVVADTIGAPIEEQVNGVENMMYMSSQSGNDGSYNLTITFEIGTDPNMAQVLVQNRVALAMPQLPAVVQLQGVTTKKTSPDIVLAVSLISPDGRFDELYLSNYATISLQDELARINGVGNINIFGQQLYSMRIWLDPNELATRGLTVLDVVSAIQTQNIQVAAGAVGQQPVPKGQRLELTLSALGQLQTVNQFSDIIIKTAKPTLPTSSAANATPEAPAGAAPPASDNSGNTGSSTAGASATSTTASTAAATPSVADSTAPIAPSAAAVVRVRDVGRVEMGAQSYTETSRLDGKPSAGIGIFLLRGANALNVADAVKKRMAELKADFPPGLDYAILYDTTPFVRQSIDEVFRALIIAVLLVAAVVLLFLQDWKAMILPMIDVPVSLVGTCVIMTFLGFSLNNLTLFGMVLAIGIVVDDSIVVLENIERHIALGKNPREATLAAMGEITGPIVAITLVLSAVFVPSAFVPGLTGQFYRQFAVTIAVAMIISAVNALTLAPSRAVFIFRTESPTDEAGRSQEPTERSHGTAPHREALPWWIFGMGGGVLTLWLAQKYLPNLIAAGDSQWRYYFRLVIAFLPGLVVGGIIGRLIIRPVNAVLGWLFGGFNRLFDRITDLYGRVIGVLVRVSVLVIVIYIGLLGLTALQVASVPKGFLPEMDQGYLLINVQLPDAASLERTEAIMARIDEMARSTPGVAHTVGVSGRSFVLGTTGSNLGSMFVVLAPFPQRGSGEYDAVIAEKLGRQLNEQIEGAIVNVFRPPPMRGLGSAGGFQLQVEQHGYVNLPKLQAQTETLIGKAMTDGKYAGMFTQYRSATPQLFVDINRTMVEAMQVPIDNVFSTLQVNMGGLYVNQFTRFGRTWEVQVQAAEGFRASAESIKQFQVRNAAGQMVPLGTLAKVQRTTGPLMVMRYNMYASAPVNGNAAPGVSSGTVIEDMEQLSRETGVPIEWTGINYLQVQAGNVALLIFVLGTLLVYLILAAKYESWRLPLAVILVVPLCMLASVTGMRIASLPVDIFVQVGLLVLVGLACKNAILIVEYGRDLRGQGKSLAEATQEASRVRFRPIVMTSLAFIFGVLPLVLASGAGAEMRRSLGIAVFTGMIGVTLFGIFLTPVFFHAISRLGSHRERGQAVT
jgi:multidrug efflux pump